MKKARQLDETATSLLRDPQPADSPLSKPAQRILPVAVRGGQFPVNPVTREHIDAALKKARLLNYRRVDLPVFPFAGWRVSGPSRGSRVSVGRTGGSLCRGMGPTS